MAVTKTHTQEAMGSKQTGLHQPCISSPKHHITTIVAMFALMVHSTKPNTHMTQDDMGCHSRGFWMVVHALLAHFAIPSTMGTGPHRRQMCHPLCCCKWLFHTHVHPPPPPPRMAVMATILRTSAGGHRGALPPPVGGGGIPKGTLD